jgi:hypothetical protein
MDMDHHVLVPDLFTGDALDEASEVVETDFICKIKNLITERMDIMPRGNGTGQGQGRGRMGGPFAAGPGGNCVCPSCGTIVPHIVGQPCNQRSCPKCGTKMTRS